MITYFQNKLHNNPLLRQVITNSTWLLLDKFFRMGLNFILTAWIAHYLGVEIFGIWNYAIAFVAIFGVFSTLGLYNIVFRDLVEEPENTAQILGVAFLLKLIGGILTLIFSYFIIQFIHPDNFLIQQITIVIGLGYIVQSLDVIDYYFQANTQAKFIVYARSLAFLFISITKVYFIYYQFSLIYFVWANTIELGIGAIFLVLIFQKNQTPILKWKIEKSRLIKMLQACLPIILAEVAIIIYMRIDQVMLGEMIGNEAVGHYSAAVRISEIWFLFPNIICSSVFPAIIQAKKQNSVLYYQRLQKIYDILAWLSIGIAIFISLFSTYLITLVYGTAYIAAAPVLALHIWSGVFVFLGMASGQYLVIENLQNLTFYRTLFGLFINLALNLLLIPYYGAIGAAIATLISYSFSAFFSNIFFKETRIIFWMNLHSINPNRILKFKTNEKLA